MTGADESDGGRGDTAAAPPSKRYPAPDLRDLPEPVRLRRVTGASVIILATALGSGEFILWPYITSQVGFIFMWAAVVGLLIQYFLNMEVERYTLATGESVVTGFARHWKPWWWLFIVFALCQNFWPGWATGSSTTLSFALGLSDPPIVPITVAALVAVGLALTLSPVVYQVIEKVQGALVAMIMVLVLVLTAVATTAEGWGALVTEGVGSPGFPIGEAGLGAALLLGALAFAGAGGANNLVQSNYIRDKGMGMGQHIPRVVSPVTGQEEAKPALGYVFPTTEDNMRRWRGWWRVANWEQFLTFFVIGVISLILLSVVAYSLLGVGNVEAEDLAFIRVEGEVLGQTIGPWAGTLFWIAGTLTLFSTNLGIIDYTCRLVADQLKINLAARSTFWSESKLYFAFVWLMVLGGTIVLVSGMDQPFVLVVISSSIAGVQMFIYSGLLIMLNRRSLPQQIRVTGVRLGVLVVSFLFFGFLSVMLVLDQF